MSPKFLSVEDVLYIHADQIRLYGGDPGLRDAGLLASAVAQPQATFGGQWLHATLQDMAAAYLFHLVMNHPFIDGNKRTGLAAALSSLAANGVRIQTQPGELFDLTLSVVRGELDKADVAAFFQTHTV